MARVPAALPQSCPGRSSDLSCNPSARLGSCPSVPWSRAAMPLLAAPMQMPAAWLERVLPESHASSQPRWGRAGRGLIAATMDILVGMHPSPGLRLQALEAASSPPVRERSRGRHASPGIPWRALVAAPGPSARERPRGRHLSPDLRSRTLGEVRASRTHSSRQTLQLTSDPTPHSRQSRPPCSQGSRGDKRIFGREACCSHAEIQRRPSI
mmetsp:Transcript_5228/g.14450  ORF Transcript_5228/g.14450 Transcript_5228/m.14450 type:complete len:211 (+) Transcript_5228:769-1401(+)